MKLKLIHWAESVFFSFPVRLFINHLKRNQVLLLWWFLLLMMITGNFGNYLGIPYLFLDPVYLNKVSFVSYLIMGVALAGLSVVFHITSYILDGPRFQFIATQKKPFLTFSINNSLVPVFFLLAYLVVIIRYQTSNENADIPLLINYLSGLMLGYLLMTAFFLLYIQFTNKDIFRYLVCKVDEKLKENFAATRANVMKKLSIAREKQKRVDSFIARDLRFKKVSQEDLTFYDRNTILQVFDQNHFNLVIIELILFIILLIIGLYKDIPLFQLPAAASTMILISIFIMFTGAFSYWFGGWWGTMFIIILLFVNFMVKQDVFSKKYEAYGLDYVGTPARYDQGRIDTLINSTNFRRDSMETIDILNQWRSKFPAGIKPKMTLVCVSGGGQRAALWTYNVLQRLNDSTGGNFMEHTMLITGASGGLIGAGFYRELILRHKQALLENLDDTSYREQLGQDNLNAVIFSFLMNDLFADIRKFQYGGFTYDRDRGYSFESQLNENTSHVFDKSILEYREPERLSEIPMMILAPTIINDGRKLFISPQHVSYMISRRVSGYSEQKVNGIEFLRFFEDQNSDGLRFLSALRMNATFPYITPNVTLPSAPPMEIMDAGITDNFGLSDATRFMYVFREWLNLNTSGVVMISIRDSQKNPPIAAQSSFSLFERLTLPISNIYQNFESLQDITNDTQLEYARAWMKVPVDRIDFEYIPEDFYKENLSQGDSLRMENLQRASLSWRLTRREKESLLDNVNTTRNKKALMKVKGLLEGLPAN